MPHACVCYSEAGVIAARIMTQKSIQVIYNTEVIKAETQPDDTCLLYTIDGKSVSVNSVLWCVEVSLSVVCICTTYVYLNMPDYNSCFIFTVLSACCYRSGGRLIVVA